MPLKKGHSPEVVSSNVRDLVRSGRKPKEAIAIALMEKRKSKMSEGGMVDADVNDEEFRSLGELMIEGDQGEITSPEEQEHRMGLAEALHKKSEDREYMSDGGLVEGDSDGELGNKPDEKSMPSATSEPLSEEQKTAIMAKKMKGRFS